MKNSNKKSNTTKKIKELKGTKADESQTFASSKAVASPERKNFRTPGSATKDKKHGL